MENESRYRKMEELIVRDEKFVFTIVSYIAILMISLNSSVVFSPAMSVPASIVYFLINGTFLGEVFFKKEAAVVRFMIGTLLLIVVLGIAAWMMMIVYTLDVIPSVVVLLVVTSWSSFLNKRMARKNAVC